MITQSTGDRDSCGPERATQYDEGQQPVPFGNMRRMPGGVPNTFGNNGHSQFPNNQGKR